MILGTGCDLIPVERLRAACERHPSLLSRLFSRQEREMVGGGGHPRWERLAGLFAAKEAAQKALGTGMRVAFADLEVEHDPRGRPLLRLHRSARAAAARLGAQSVHVSISHSGGFALATAIAEGTQPPGAVAG